MRNHWLLMLALLVGCAGTQRNCSSCSAGSFGADWVIVQTTMDGRPFRCWELHDVSVGNEDHSDGIYWQSADGHLVHLSNNYIRVQVGGGDYDGALRELGMGSQQCQTLGTRKLESAP